MKNAKIVKTKPKNRNPKRAPDDPTPYNRWWCVTCHGMEMTHGDMIEHLRVVHGLETQELKCSKRMIQHVDADTWFRSDYEIKVNDVELRNEVLCLREKDDMMRFA